jgi:hypothetical protein
MFRLKIIKKILETLMQSINTKIMLKKIMFNNSKLKHSQTFLWKLSSHCYNMWPPFWNIPPKWWLYHTAQLIPVRCFIYIVATILVCRWYCTNFPGWLWMWRQPQSQSRKAEWIFSSMATTTKSNQDSNMCFPSQYARYQPCVGCSIH